MMIKNNVIALCVHFFSIIILAIATPIFGCDEYTPCFGIAVLAMISLISLVLVGYILKQQGSKIRNCLSVSAVTIFGMISWLFGTLINVLPFKFTYIIFIGNIIAVTSYFQGSYNYTNSINRFQLVQIGYTVIPTFLIWIGMELKAVQEKKKRL